MQPNVNPYDTKQHSVPTYQTCSKDNIALNVLLCLLHLFVKTRVSYHTSGTHHLTARFIQSTDTSDNGSFQNIGEICNVFKGLQKIRRVNTVSYTHCL